MSDAARLFALAAHGDQRYGDEPYGIHLAEVARVLSRFDIRDKYFIEAAWLHDVLEDTPTTFDELSQAFGWEVATIARAVTNEPGANRKERALKTYPKIREFGILAVIVKVADRIANTEHSVLKGTRHLEMYRREFPAFEAALYQAGECDAMWEHLRRISA